MSSSVLVRTAAAMLVSLVLASSAQALVICANVSSIDGNLAGAGTCDAAYFRAVRGGL